MKSRTLTIVLVVGLLLLIQSLVPLFGALRLPGNHEGYEPEQPIAFSHRLHAGEMAIDCLYCHSGAERSSYAGIPAASLCMNCHEFVSAPIAQVAAEKEKAKKEGREPRKVVSPEIQKIYDHLALGPDKKRDPGKEPVPIEWIRVYDLPAHVKFDHRPHVAAGVECQSCHGPVQTMERVRQVPDLSMGWCVNCHRMVNEKGVDGREVNASTDCAACHY